MNKNIGDNELRMYDEIGIIYSNLQNLMGAIYDGHPFTTEELLEALGDISNKVLNTKEGYVANHMGNDTNLLYSVDCERYALNQALSAQIEGKSQTR